MWKRLALILFVLGICVNCGKKGPPQPQETNKNQASIDVEHGLAT